MRLRGAVTGSEARAFNNLRVNRVYGNPVDLLAFGPDVNLIVDPRNGRNGENPSEDGTLAGIYAAEYVRGAQNSADDAGHLMLSMAVKHYAGYESETNRFDSDFAFSNFDLLDTFLVPYDWAFRVGGAVGSMCSYNSLNNVSACADHWLLTDMVRGYWGRPDAWVLFAMPPTLPRLCACASARNFPDHLLPLLAPLAGLAHQLALTLAFPRRHRRPFTQLRNE